MVVVARARRQLLAGCTALAPAHTVVCVSVCVLYFVEERERGRGSCEQERDAYGCRNPRPRFAVSRDSVNAALEGIPVSAVFVQLYRPRTCSPRSSARKPHVTSR